MGKHGGLRLFSHLRYLELGQYEFRLFRLDNYVDLWRSLSIKNPLKGVTEELKSSYLTRHNFLWTVMKLSEDFRFYFIIFRTVSI